MCVLICEVYLLIVGQANNLDIIIQIYPPTRNYSLNNLIT